MEKIIVGGIDVLTGEEWQRELTDEEIEEITNVPHQSQFLNGASTE